MSLLDRLKRRAVHELKVTLAGDDLDTLVERRDRRRLRWIAEEGESPEQRILALWHLAELGDPEVAPHLLSILEAPAGQRPALVVRLAALGLGRLRHRPALPALRRLLTPERPTGVRLAAARALAVLGGADAWAAVRRFCQEANDDSPLLPDLRDTCLPVESGPAPVAIAALVFQACYADQDGRWWSQKAAAWLRGADEEPRVPANHGADRAVSALLRNTLERGELDDDAFRFTVLHLATLARARDGALLSRLLEHHPMGPRHRALVQALGLQGDPRNLPLLDAAARAATDHSARLDAARALGRLSWPEAAPILAAMQAHATPELREEIAWALGEAGGPDAVRALIAVARDEDGRLLPGDRELAGIGRALKACGDAGREAVRGALTIARAGGGERGRLERVAEAAHIR